MNNYDEVASAVQMMIDPQAFALRRSAVTISTVGVIPRMLQMMTDLPGVSLALSLHAPTQELRKTIVPSAKAYPLDKLMAAVDKYQMHTRQKVITLAPYCSRTALSITWFCNVLCAYVMCLVFLTGKHPYTACASYAVFWPTSTITSSCSFCVKYVKSNLTTVWIAVDS